MQSIGVRMKLCAGGLGALCLVGCGGNAPEEDAAAPKVAATTTVSPSDAASTAKPVGQRQLDRIGIQLYTLRAHMAEDFEGTLRKVAALGYTEVETAGLFGRDAADVRVLLDELGLSVPASHVSWQPFTEDPEKAIADAKTLGADYVVLAWVPEDRRETLAHWREWIAFMNEVGAMAKAEGLTFAFHNHEFEFEPIDGVVPYDLILAETDPELVKLELDLYWAVLAGVDPVALLKAHPGRFPLSHVKDMDPDTKGMVDVGRGAIDFATIFAAAEAAGMKHFIVEHDNPANAFATAAFAINHLKDLSY